MRELVAHVIEVHGMFQKLVGRSLVEHPEVEDDPLGAWTAVRDQMQADLDDPVRANEEYDGMLGRSTFGASVDGFVCFDLVVHGWDLARATGQDETIDPEDIEPLQAMVDSMGPMMVENGVIKRPARAGARRIAAGTAAGRPRTAGLTPEQVRAAALAFPGATERDHHGFPSFRTPRRIFATMPDDEQLRVMLPEEDIRAAVAEWPDWCEELWWGKKLPRCGSGCRTATPTWWPSSSRTPGGGTPDRTVRPRPRRQPRS